ncbi:MAG: hypothetical protein QOE28_2068 [Solirubrobacteraceae bacterium]|jgi:hypothetical protein|nr:hypothetical protein [Solirubrobacteraceae bacterium]
MRARAIAWWYTGPLGHLWAGVADWTEMLVRWQWRRMRERS